MSEKKIKVVAGLKCCIVRNPDDRPNCVECPYRDPTTYCLNRLKMDALELLLDESVDEPSCGPDYCDIEE